MTTKLARAAVWYARHGWKIFPLRPHTKEPFAKLGVYNATGDLRQVGRWWQIWPQANIGLHCGASGILALDADAYKDGYAGDEFLAGADEQTVTNLTGSGGAHLLFQMPEGAKYGNATGDLPPGIDIRGWGGYIVLPPSVHPNGTPYQWELGYGPHEIALLPLPECLREILDSCKTGRVAGPPDVHAVAVAAGIVESLLRSLGVQSYPVQEYDDAGRKWILKQCPFMPAGDPHDPDKAAFVIVARDGRISAGCHHARCREVLKQTRLSGWDFLMKLRGQYVGG